MRYVAVLGGKWVGLVGFGSAALSCAALDRYLGWSRVQQYARLRHVVNNQRFCVLPGGRRRNLASAVLARALRRSEHGDRQFADEGYAQLRRLLESGR